MACRNKLLLLFKKCVGQISLRHIIINIKYASVCHKSDVLTSSKAIISFLNHAHNVTQKSPDSV